MHLATKFNSKPSSILPVPDWLPLLRLPLQSLAAVQRAMTEGRLESGEVCLLSTQKPGLSVCHTAEPGLTAAVTHAGLFKSIVR